MMATSASAAEDKPPSPSAPAPTLDANAVQPAKTLNRHLRRSLREKQKEKQQQQQQQGAQQTSGSDEDAGDRLSPSSSRSSLGSPSLHRFQLRTPQQLEGAADGESVRPGSSLKRSASAAKKWGMLRSTLGVVSVLSDVREKREEALKQVGAPRWPLLFLCRAVQQSAQLSPVPF